MTSSLLDFARLSRARDIALVLPLFACGALLCGIALLCGETAHASAMPAAPQAPSVQPLQLEKLLGSDPAAGDYFGFAVSIDGDRALVGAPHDSELALEAGAAYVFERQASGHWLQTAKLQASDAAAYHYFGRAVSLSRDHALIGAYSHDGVGAPPGPTPDSGAAYVFECTNGRWSEAARLLDPVAEAGDNFGFAVSISSDHALVGAPRDDAGGANAGAAHAFRRTSSGWQHVSTLLASNGAAGDRFGFAVSVHNQRGLIGALGHAHYGAYSGAAYVFQRDALGTWTEHSILLPSDGEPGEQFGRAVALTDATIAVGAPIANHAGAHSGAVYVYERQIDGAWPQIARLTVADAAADDELGNAISLAPDGQSLLAGAQGTHSASGAAHLFRRPPGAAWEHAQTLRAADEHAGDIFGFSLGLGKRYCIVGAWKNDDHGPLSGAAYTFDLVPWETTPPQLSLSQGGAQDWVFSAGVQHAGSFVLVLGSALGTEGGLRLANGLTLPLAQDDYFQLTLTQPNSGPWGTSFAPLPAGGEYAGRFELPAGANPSLAGLVLHHAALLIDPVKNDVAYVSPPAPLTLLP